MSPRPDVSQERIARIIEAAIAVLVRAGMAGLRIEDVAREAGISKGSVYLYFDSKEELLTAVIESFVGQPLDALRTMLDRPGAPATERILTMIAAVGQQMRALSDVISIWLEFYSLAARDSKVQAAFAGYFAGYRGIVRELVEQGIAGGEFAPVDAEEVAVAISALIEGTGILWTVDRDAVQLERQLEVSVRLLLAGLQARPEHNEGRTM